MSDELAPGAMSLEEPELVGPVTQTTNEPPAQTDDDAPPAGTIEGSGGVKFVPLGAVLEERTKAKAAKAERDTLKTELESVRGKADQWDRAKAQVEQALPLIEKMKNRPDLMAQLDKPPAQAETPKPLSDTEAVEYAKDFDLYKTDGTPDVDRAQRIAARHEALADRRAEAKVAPFRQNDHQRASADIKAKLLTYKDHGGNVIDPAALEQVWGIVPPELSARPEVAEVLYLLAKGIQSGKPGKPAGPGPVLQTESIGGGGKVDSDKPSRFATAAGIPQAEFRKTSSAFKPGAVNVLE